MFFLKHNAMLTIFSVYRYDYSWAGGYGGGDMYGGGGWGQPMGYGGWGAYGGGARGGGKMQRGRGRGRGRGGPY